MRNNVDAVDGVHLDSDEEIKGDSDDGEEEDEEQKFEEENDQEDDGKKPQTIRQEEIVNTSADNVHTMVDDQPFVLSKQGQVIHDHTPWLQPMASAPWPQTPEHCPQPKTPETDPLIGQELWGI